MDIKVYIFIRIIISVLPVLLNNCKLYDQDNKNNSKVGTCKFKKHPGYSFFFPYNKSQAKEYNNDPKDSRAYNVYQA